MLPPETPPNAIITSAHTADDETPREIEREGEREREKKGTKKGKKKCMCLIWYPANTEKQARKGK
jgi:hypothetical protein